MAIGATTNWYVRVAGNELNGGGYDPGIAGAGINYADQDSPQLSLTDIVTIGTTTVTSVTGGFTSAMIGNCLRVAGDGYYFITARGSSNSVTVDRVTGTGTGQSGRVGGAHATLVNYSNGGSGLPSPILSTPLAAGHTINMRGSGPLDPSTVDYDFTAGYWTFPSGSLSVGPISLIGYNGRPHISHSGRLFDVTGAATLFWQATFVKFSHLAPGATDYGVFGYPYGGSVFNCIFDNFGYDAVGCTVVVCVNCLFRQTGSVATGIKYRSAIATANNGQTVIPMLIKGNYVYGWMGSGISDANLGGGGFGISISNNIVNFCQQDGIYLVGSQASSIVEGNTIYASGADGIELTTNQQALCTVVNNNVVNSGGYGLNCGGGAANLLKALVLFGYNNYYNNASGDYNGVSAAATDLALDPQFTNPAGGDFSIGTNLKAAGFPQAFPGISTTSYVDMGAVQRQESGGGGASVPFVAGMDTVAFRFRDYPVG